MRFSRLMITALLVGIAFGVQTCVAQDRQPPKSVDELQQRIESILDKSDIPGLIGVVVDGNQGNKDDMIWQGAIGMSDVDSGTPVSLDSRFRLGSITKSILSLGVLKLVEQNRLTLSEPVQPLVPDLQIRNPWDESRPVRLVHLLEHTSGLPDVALRGYSLGSPSKSTFGAIEQSRPALDVRWCPGTRMAYSNLGPSIVALAIEGVTNQPIEEFLRTELFDPLQMNGATLFASDAIASSYQNGELLPYSYILRPSGGMSATSGDMAQLLRLLIHRGTVEGVRLLESDSIVRMETPTSTLAAKAGLQVGYGLGNYTMQEQGFVFHGHGGGVDGFISRFAYLPEAKRGYFISVNGRNVRAFEELNDELIAFVTRDLTRPTPTRLIETNREELESLEGTYVPDSPSSALNSGVQSLGFSWVRAEEDELMFAGKRLQPVGNRQFIEPGNALPSFVFMRSSDQKFLLQSGDQTWKRVHPVQAYARPIGMIVSLICSMIPLFTAPLWLLTKLFKKDRKRQPDRAIRLLPLFSISTLLGTVLSFSGLRRFAGPEMFAMPTLGSMGVFVGTIAFAILSSMSLLCAIWRFPKRKEIGSFTWATACISSAGLVALTIQLFSMGMIGLRTWSG